MKTKYKRPISSYRKLIARTILIGGALLIYGGASGVTTQEVEPYTQSKECCVIPSKFSLDKKIRELEFKDE
jgi:hypothetical protein